MEKLHPSSGQVKFRKFWAVVQKKTYSSPVRLTLEAATVEQAIDDMYIYVGANQASDIVEYEMFEIIRENAYVPVSKKYKEDTVAPAPAEVVRVFTEQKYISYRHKAET